MLKRALMWGIMLCVPLLFSLLCLEGYYAYHKLAYRGVFCSSFATLDGEIGWVLESNAQSCYGLWRSGARDERAFYSRIYTDENGFRSAAPGLPTATSGVMLVGDSWTFGYGVDYEDTFAGRLARQTGEGVVTVASPAYGAAQALLLAERWLEAFTPTAIVYLDIGHWARSACTGRTRPRVIFKPCYWSNPASGNPELVVPPAGFVEAAGRWGIKPGGMLGAGEDGWDYFLISRPVSKLLGLLARADLVSGMAHDFRAVGVDEGRIREGVMQHLLRLADKSGVPLIVLDPLDSYAALEQHPQHSPGLRIVRIGRSEWSENVADPASKLPPDQQKVPQDGHFGPGTNALIAAYLARLLARIETTPGG
jgi:hypothetical protein